MKTFILALALFSTSAFAADVVEFHILYGTGTGAWNTSTTVVQTKVGQILRVINDDNVPHRLHTNGAPCAHGPQIAPGASWDCNLAKTYTEAANGAIYDHNAGSNARFYLETVAAD